MSNIVSSYILKTEVEVSFINNRLIVYKIMTCIANRNSMKNDLKTDLHHHK